MEKFDYRDAAADERQSPKGARILDFKKIAIGAGWALGLSIAAVWLLLRLTGVENFSRQVGQVQVVFLVLGVSMIALSWWFDTIRLVILSRSLGRRLSLAGAFKITMMSSFMAGVTPFDTGGEPLKVYLLHREGVPLGEGAAIVALAALLHATSRLLLFLVAPLVALATGVAWAALPAVKAALGLGLFIYLVFLGLMIASLIRPEIANNLARRICRSRVVSKITSERTREEIVRRVSTHVQEFREGVLRFSNMRLYAGTASLLSVAYWLSLTLVPFFILTGVGVGASYPAAFATTMSLYLVTAYVPTPGASGGAEIGSAALFAAMVPSRLIGVFVLLWRLVSYYLTMAVGGLFIAFETISWSFRKIVAD
ncbi:MAG: flippase-like domain-containing protein [Firmicutes bacterium]|nr:flippase-like domain-containing protein [Candidatus Fermentithermobacillaceae bacterium]